MGVSFWIKAANRYRVLKMLEKDLNAENKNLNRIIALKNFQRKLNFLSKRITKRALTGRYGGKTLSEWQSLFKDSGAFIKASLFDLDKTFGIFKLNRGHRILYIGAGEDLGREVSHLRRTCRKDTSLDLRTINLSVLELTEKEYHNLVPSLKTAMIAKYRPVLNIEERYK